ncbi:MAG TPA: hypothetical protein VER17_05665 [Tepidisphaeraceae bacterium]|nr:hypothetical protein [Tepidisphaeraceae bacterium]
MLTTVAVLVIVLGLMVSLARDVRARSAERLTKELLRRLDVLVAQYRTRNLKGLPEQAARLYPRVESLFADDPRADDEAKLRANAQRNNRQLVRTLKSQADLAGGAFSDLSIANYNEVNVLDAWGSPVAYMPHQHPLAGMAGGDRYFFFSAGPDRRYLTRQDNLYSYENTSGGGGEDK